MNSVPARLFGVIRYPRPAFAAVMARPDWLLPLVLTTVVVAAAGAAVFATEVGRLALLDDWERSAIAFGRSVDDEDYGRLEALSQQGEWYAVARALLTGPVALGAVATVLYVAFRRRRPETGFTQVLAVVVYSGVILALRQLVAAPAVMLRETTASATSIGVWFPLFDEASPVARLLAMIDLFMVWWLVVLAVGASVLWGIRTRRAAAMFLGAYLAFAVLMAAAMALLGGTT